MKQTFKQTISLIKSDMQHRCDYEGKSLSFIQTVKFLFNPAMVSTMLYRIQQFFHLNHLSLLGVIPKALNSIFFSISIHPRTEIGPGLLILHSMFILIGPNVKIGRNFILGHHNSIAPSPFYTPEAPRSIIGPVIGDNVILSGGASISGEITLGDNVKISMGSAVHDSFPEDSVLFGVPAKVISKAKSKE